MKREESTQSGTIEELRERRAKKQAARRRQVLIYRGMLVGGIIAFIVLCSIFVLAGRQQREPVVSESMMESQASPSLESAGNSQSEATPSEILGTEESEDELLEAMETEDIIHTATVNVETYLNIRVSPADDAVILAQMEAGAVCEVLETGDPWYHIRYEEMEGYVNGAYLVFGDESD